jgi:nitrite reductase (NADH) large subunit
LVVVGGGMAAQRFIERLVAGSGARDYSIVLLCEELPLPYDRIHLAFVLEGKSPRSLSFRDESWYASHGIEVRSKDAVLAIEPERRVVRTDSGHEIAYDQLVLATGSQPVVPPIPGARVERVLTYRTVDDVERIAARAVPGAHLVVLGGGLLGIEAAHTLRLRGCMVDVVERALRLLPRQLDVEGAAVLQRQLEAAGIGLRLNAQVAGIAEVDEGVEVELEGGERIPAQALVVAIGIRPRDELARAAGLDCDRSGGVLVDDRLVTSDPRIHAIGECARHRGETPGFVAPCYGMADVLAACFAGQTESFEGVTPSARLKIDTIDVGAVGESLAEGIGVQSLDWATPDEYRRVVLRGGRVVGAIAVGSTDDLPALQEHIARRARLFERQRRRFAKTGRLSRVAGHRPIASWSDDTVVCVCTGVSCGVLRNAQASGAQQSAALCQATGAGSVCGSCRPLVEELAGEREGATREASGAGLAVAALGALFLMAVACWLAPVPMADSFESTPGWDVLWRDAWWKQVSGFTLLAMTAATLLLSFRKRWRRITWGAFSSWRLVHAAVGAATIVGLGFHTGFRMGANLNFALMACFAAVLVLGSATALVTSLESRLPAGLGGLLRRGWTLAHVALFWPLPVLIGFHVLAVYFY